MSSLFDSTLIAICVGAHGTANTACLKAMDAGTRQVGLRQNADLVQDKAVHLANYHVENNLSKDQFAALGAGVYLYKITRDKRLSLKMPTFGLCDRATSDITLDTYQLLLKWSF